MIAIDSQLLTVSTLRGPNDLPRDPRVHIYDVYDNELWETRQIPCQAGPVFGHFVGDATSNVLVQEAETAFYRLESEVEAVLTQFMERAYASGTPRRTSSFSFDSKPVDSLSRYFAFLRFRNSAKYRGILESLEEPIEQDHSGSIYPAYRPLIAAVCRRVMLREFIRFLDDPSEDGSPHWRRDPRTEHHTPSTPSLDAFRDAMEMYCWRLRGAEVCIGIPVEEQEFILPDSCFGTLDEGFDDHP